mgnify:CR=1 FL=1
MIIQPVVENAVKHGLRPNKGSGEVVVQAKQNMDFLEITVMDNGVGINKERLEEVQALLKSDARVAEEDIKGMSIGVKNSCQNIGISCVKNEFLTVLNICTEMSMDWKLMHMKEWAPL